jgi:hypothetical protein
MDGTAMVVTDLHGDWDIYRRYRDLFIRGYDAGDIQHIIFAGDLIHRESAPEDDKSLAMVLDVLALQESYHNAVIHLCGNHEMPHIYSVILTKGDFIYTVNFEAGLGAHRTKIIEHFQSLPFFVRTAAGVAITHAGAAVPMQAYRNCERLFTFDHQTIFTRVDRILRGKDLETLRSGLSRFSDEPYHVQARKYLAVTDRDDPRYDNLLRGFIASSDPNFDLLWTALFTRCEKEYGSGDYGRFLDGLLNALSADFTPQKLLVAGHLDVNGGYEVVGRRHLRLASGKHARPPTSARYLVFDVSQPLRSMQGLLSQIRPLY